MIRILKLPLNFIAGSILATYMQIFVGNAEYEFFGILII